MFASGLLFFLIYQVYLEDHNTDIISNTNNKYSLLCSYIACAYVCNWFEKKKIFLVGIKKYYSKTILSSSVSTRKYMQNTFDELLVSD